MLVCINDVETSGRSKWYHDVVSLGSVIADYNPETKSLDIIDTFYEECSPWDIKAFDHDTVEVHGLTLRHLMDQQSSYDLCAKWMWFLNPYRDKNRVVYLPFVYHALNRFDFTFVYNMFLKNDLQFHFQRLFHREHSFSTIKIARSLGITDNGLDVWASDRLMMPLNHHNALSDTKLTAHVLEYLLNRGASLESGFEIKKSDRIEDEEDETEQNSHKKKRKKLESHNLAMEL